MKQFEVAVPVTCKALYIVEANNKAEAAEKVIAGDCHFLYELGTRESDDPSTFTIDEVSSCEWLEFVEQQLDAIESLPVGWDLHGALQPTPSNIKKARELISCLAQEDISDPHVNPTPGGGVQFEWESEFRYFELVVEKEVTFLYTDEKGEVEGTISVEDSLLPVLNFIQKVDEEA